MTTVTSEIIAKASKKLEDEIQLELDNNSEEKNLGELYEDTERDDKRTGDGPDTKDS